MGSQAEFAYSQLLEQNAALQAEVERLRVSPETLPEKLAHGMNCGAWINDGGFEVNGEDCTCGYRYRIQLQTEQNIRAAWMKRANEAEAERDSLREQLSTLQLRFNGLAEVNKAAAEEVRELREQLMIARRPPFSGPTSQMLDTCPCSVCGKQTIFMCPFDHEQLCGEIACRETHEADGKCASVPRA